VSGVRRRERIPFGEKATEKISEECPESCIMGAARDEVRLIVRIKAPESSAFVFLVRVSDWSWERLLDMKNIQFGLEKRKISAKLFLFL
jgi:hypothetical protein